MRRYPRLPSRDQTAESQILHGGGCVEAHFQFWVAAPTWIKLGQLTHECFSRWWGCWRIKGTSASTSMDSWNLLVASHCASLPAALKRSVIDERKRVHSACRSLPFCLLVLGLLTRVAIAAQSWIPASVVSQVLSFVVSSVLIRSLVSVFWL